MIPHCFQRLNYLAQISGRVIEKPIQEWDMPQTNIFLCKRADDHEDPNGPLTPPIVGDTVEKKITGGLSTLKHVELRALAEPTWEQLPYLLEVILDPLHEVCCQDSVDCLSVWQKLAILQFVDSFFIREFEFEAEVIAAAESGFDVIGKAVPDGGVGQVHGAKEINRRINFHFPQIGSLMIDIGI